MRDPHEIQKRAEAELPLEKVFGDWPVSSDPQVHIKAVSELFESGAQQRERALGSGQSEARDRILWQGKYCPK